jgi:predicted Zn-dependent peptidase
MLLDYLRGKYLPRNTVVAVAGNIEHGAVVEAVGKSLGDWIGAGQCPDFVSYIGGPNPRLKIERRDTEQSHFCLALPGVPLKHPDRFPLDLLNIVLGEGMSSRLFNEVRDKLGLAYSINSYADHFLDSGAMTIYAGTEPKNLPVAISAVIEQLSKLKEPVPEAEMTKAKELSKGRLMLRLEDTRSVAGWLGSQEVLLDEILTPDQVVSIIDSITAEQMVETARKLINAEALRLAVVGPAGDGAALENLLDL